VFYLGINLTSPRSIGIAQYPESYPAFCPILGAKALATYGKDTNSEIVSISLHILLNF
jgi:hypothetical protein